MNFGVFNKAISFLYFRCVSIKYINEFINYLSYRIKYFLSKSSSYITDPYRVVRLIMLSQFVLSTFDVLYNYKGN